MFLCVEDLCFSNIPSKSDRYKYYCHRFFLVKMFERDNVIFGERENGKVTKSGKTTTFCL
jgi:hypothetical protein